MRMAREMAGGQRQKDIIVFTYANEGAVEFYSKMGMRKSNDMMKLTNVEWTEFEVGEDFID